MPKYFLIAITICAVVASMFAIRAKRRHDAMVAAMDGSLPRTRDYSADYIQRDLKNPQRDRTSKIYVHVTHAAGGFYLRSDSSNANHHRRVVIRTPDLNVALDPDARTYWKLKIYSSVSVSRGGGPMVGGPETTKKFIGKEKLNGRDAYHWEITDPLPDNHKLVSQYWEDSRMRIAMKEDKPGISFYELTNFHEAEQPAVLFTLPKDYKEIDPPPPQSPPREGR